MECTLNQPPPSLTHKPFTLFTSRLFFIRGGVFSFILIPATSLHVHTIKRIHTHCIALLTFFVSRHCFHFLFLHTGLSTWLSVSHSICRTVPTGLYKDNSLNIHTSSFLAETACAVQGRRAHVCCPTCHASYFDGEQLLKTTATFCKKTLYL